jgi:hypothetical protein
MVDRLISQGVWLIVMGLIALTFGGAILCGYRGLFEIISGHLIAALACLIAAPSLGVAARMLIHNKEDLTV